MIGDRPELSFLDDTNKPYMTLAGGTGPFLTLSQPGDALQRQITLTAGKALFGMAIYGPRSSACSKVGCVSAGLSLVENSPAFSLYDDQGVEVANMQWGKKVGAQLMLGGLESKQQAVLALDSAGTRLTLRDGNGFHSVLGNNELETETTGETHHTSAASLVMLK
jgi:hypothetical protein